MFLQSKNSLFTKNIIFKSQLFTSKLTFPLYSLQTKQITEWRKEFPREFYKKYYDVERDRTFFQREVKDYKRIPLKTRDPLYFETMELHDMTFKKALQNLIDNDIVGFASKISLSPYRIINLLYNISICDQKEKYADLFTKLEATINTINVDPKTCNPRYLMGYLTAIYRMGIWKPENKQYFENSIPKKVYNINLVTLLELYEAASYNKIETSRHILNSLSYSIVLFDQDGSFLHRPEGVLRLMKLLTFGEYFEIEFQEMWKIVIKQIKAKLTYWRVENYDEILKCLTLYYESPKSTLYQDPEILELLDSIKKHIKEDENLKYFYNADEMKFRTYFDLRADREEKTNSIYYLRSIKHKKSITYEEEVEEEVEVEKEELMQNITKKLESASTIKEDDDFHPEIETAKDAVLFLIDENPHLRDQYLKILEDMEREEKQNIIDKLVKEKKFDQLFEKKPEVKPKPVAAAGDKGGKGKGKK